MKSSLTLQTKPSMATQLEKLGAVTKLVTRTREYRSFIVSALHVWIEPAIDFDQIRVFYNTSGEPVGYVTWAWLDPRARERFIHDPRFLFHPSDWTEGPELWILDFVAPFGHASDMWKQLRTEPRFTETEAFSYLRRRADGSIRRVTTRKNRRFRVDDGESS
mgnify:CR=1 FL=1